MIRTGKVQYLEIPAPNFQQTIALRARGRTEYSLAARGSHLVGPHHRKGAQTLDPKPDTGCAHQHPAARHLLGR
jgi:hypothetical protein